MTAPSHLIVGLLLGKLTGNYAVAITSSLVIDIDHLISYYKHGILFKPREFWNAITTETDPWDDQRNILHSVVSWFLISGIFFLFNQEMGIVVLLGYLCHLLLDALDAAP